MKDYLLGRQPQPLEQASGALFISMNVLMFLSDARPKLKIASGILGLLGATALGYSAQGQDGAAAQIFACSITAALSLSIILENKFNALAKKAEEGGKGILKKIFTPLAKYPVATMAGVDLMLSSLPMAYAATVRHDPGLMAATFSWIIGGLALMATDNGIKNRLPSKPNMALYR